MGAVIRAANGTTARQLRQWRAGKSCPPGALRSKPKNDASGWLRRVRPAVRIQGPDSEVRVLVHKTSVFSAQREVPAQNIISADAVEKGSSPLILDTGNRSA